MRVTEQFWHLWVEVQRAHTHPPTLRQSFADRGAQLGTPKDAPRACIEPRDCSALPAAEIGRGRHSGRSALAGAEVVLLEEEAYTPLAEVEEDALPEEETCSPSQVAVAVQDPHDSPRYVESSHARDLGSRTSTSPPSCASSPCADCGLAAAPSTQNRACSLFS